MMPFFRLVNDMQIPNRRFLNEPVDAAGQVFDDRIYTQGIRLDQTPPQLRYPVFRKGRTFDLSLEGHGVPIVRQPVGQLLESIDPVAVQRILVQVEGDSGSYEILNVTSVVDCLDEQASQPDRFTADDPGCSDRAGEINAVLNLVIDPARAAGQHIFRLKTWRIPIIVSQAVKDALERAEVRGVRFISVMPGDGDVHERWRRGAGQHQEGPE